MISLSSLGVYIEKINVRVETPYEDGPLRKRLKHQTEVGNNPC